MKIYRLRTNKHNHQGLEIYLLVKVIKIVLKHAFSQIAQRAKLNLLFTFILTLNF